MQNVYTEHYIVRHREADRNGELRLSSWFDFLQEAAANHANDLGVGLGMLQQNNMIWVLSRLKLAMDRSPRIGERVSVETYPNGFRRIYASRQFRVVGGDGGEIGRGSSRWLLLGLPRMRPLKLENLPVELPDNSALADYFDLEDKLSPRGIAPELFVPIRYSMEDVNAHLNNSEYAGIVQDFAVKKYGNSPRFRTVELHFLSAVKAGDTLSVGGECSEKSLFVEGTSSSDAISFTALATF
jgi:acyl-ACP thioesterase